MHNRIFKNIRIAFISGLAIGPLAILGAHFWGLGSSGFFITTAVGVFLAYAMNYNWRGVEVVSSDDFPTPIKRAVENLIWSGTPLIERWNANTAVKKVSTEAIIRTVGGGLARSSYSSIVELQNYQDLPNFGTSFNFQVRSSQRSLEGFGVLMTGKNKTQTLSFYTIEPRQLMDDTKMGATVVLIAPIVMGVVGSFYKTTIPALVFSVFLSSGMAIFSYLNWSKANRALLLKTKLNLNRAWLLSHEGGAVARASGYITPVTITDELVKKLDNGTNNLESGKVVLYSSGEARIILILDSVPPTSVVDWMKANLASL